MKTLQKVLLLVLLSSPVVAVEKPAAVPAAKVAVKEKVYELPKTGLNQARPQGGWINVEANGTRLVVKFFDKKKKPVAPDMARGLVQLRYASKNPARAVLLHEGDTLATPATIRPPHNYLVILSLFAADGGEAAESHTFKYP